MFYLTLKLRVLVGPDPAWPRAELLSLSLSPSRTDPAAPGAVTLVERGCRLDQFAGIVPNQPWHVENNTAEVVSTNMEMFLM